jgi:hypothetical protein
MKVVGSPPPEGKKKSRAGFRRCVAAATGCKVSIIDINVIAVPRRGW